MRGGTETKSGMIGVGWGGKTVKNKNAADPKPQRENRWREHELS